MTLYTLDTHQSLLINRNSNAADIALLLDSYADYLIPREESQTIVKEVCHAVSKWHIFASRLKAPQREIDYFKGVFNRSVTPAVREY